MARVLELAAILRIYMMESTVPREEIHGIHTTSDSQLTWRFLCTNAAAEVIYFTVNEMLQNQSLYTDDLTNIFYKRFVPSINGSTTYPANSSQYQTILQGMVTFADSFMATVQTHARTNGSLNEEFDR